MLSMLRLHNVENDRYSVFIIGSNKTLISIGCISSHYSISLHAALCWLMIRNNNSCAGLEWKFPSLIVFISIMDHLVYV